MATKKEDVKFEDNLAELENIVRKLESGDVALEDAIAEFQKGMKISETLKKTLNEAEETLVKIVGKKNNGELLWFDEIIDKEYDYIKNDGYNNLEKWINEVDKVKER